ncbi:MAG: ABC transporter substrate-binding protein [Paludibacteraceae bacterium]|nr:ABC transporter substrate-binding protein [Paludibacteraceae bacterium]MBQ9704606.1 ABC transporter substrate-binding protein [Paludibacteraceae bacterium]
MKRFFSFLFVAVLAASSFALDRDHTLKVYNWADYIDEDVLKQFPAWYKQMTGEDVDVIYQTFDINESMLTEIEVGHEDYDVICPSEYIIERMLKAGLLKKIDKELIPDSLRQFDNVAPFAVDKFQQMSKTENVSDYTVGYMWGTTGFIYNPAYVNREDLHSWGAILDPKFEGKIYMKDAFRDVYSVIVLYAYRDEIAAGTVTRDELVENITPERIKRVEEVLVAAKDNVAGWEVDFGKEEMTKGKTWMNLSWSGDAQWAIDEAAEVGVNLEYIVPDEGSNVWFDGWCIPKYAKNEKAASWFINYMCIPANAIKNMDFIGYVSVIATPEVLDWVNNEEEWEEPLDLSYFFGEEATSVHANPVLYADKSVIDRCALMHDAGEMNEELVKMWNRVKGDNLSSTMLIVVLVVLVLLIAFVVMQFVSKRNRRNAQVRRRRK